VLVATVLIVGCRGGAISTPHGQPATVTEAPGGAVVEPRERRVVELTLDQTVDLADLRVRWLELSDSRCPREVQCVWEGEAVVTLEVSRDDGRSRRLALDLRPGTGSEVVTVLGHELRLVSVEPYPREGVEPRRDDYRAAVEIGRS
ncbi:MAG: hypothetical protein ACE5EG_10565, partial [Thermoanaerobaculia bacterium]